MIAEASTSSSVYHWTDSGAWARHCERSEAIHLSVQRKNGLLRRGAPSNDGCLGTPKRRPEVPVAITVFIRYQLDPFKRAMFEQYAKRWLAIIPRCGGDLVAYWMPPDGTQNVAVALIS